MVNFGLLATEIISLVWGAPANFNGFSVLAALLLRGTLVVGVSKTLWQQRAPPIFGRAAITLGIGSHSSLDHELTPPDMHQKLGCQSDHVMHCFSSNLVNCCTTVQKLIWKGLQQVNDLEGHSRSSEMAQFDRPNITVSDLKSGCKNEIFP